MSRAGCLLLVIASFACGACGGESPPVVMPPLHVTAKPPAPERARWVFAAPEQELRAKLDLGDGQTLYVGEHGRRELGTASGLTHATTLALEGLAGVVRDGKRFVFVASDGDVYTSTEPLGALERVRPARAEVDALTSVTTGRAAFVGINASGALMRSQDFGATWQAIDYAHAKLAGGAAGVALDSKGNGVLVHLPQRLFVTHDDGATWAPLASPQTGAVSVMRDGADRIFVTGYRDHAVVLEGDKLVATQAPKTPIFAVAAVAAGGLEDAAARTFLTGDHVVQITLRASGTERPAVDVRSAKLGEPLPEQWTSHPELVPAGPWSQTLSKRIAAYGGELVFLHGGEDPNDDKTTDDVKPITTTVYRSKDYGATWQKEDVLQGTFSEEPHAGVDVAIGPRGWMYVGALCPSQFSRDCKPAKVRPAGKRAFEELPAPITPLAIVFDEPRDKAYVLSHEGRKVISELALGGTKLERTTLLNALPSTDVAITVDASGTLRVFEREGKYWTVRRRNAKGAIEDPTFVAIQGGRLALAGVHGLSIGDHDGWETNDAGDTWTRVSSNGSTKKLMCDAAGCLLDDAQRVGWDLPAVTSTDIMRAQATAPEDKTLDRKPPPVGTPVKVTCQASGTPAPLDLVDWMDGTTAQRWAELDTDFAHGAVGVTWGSKDAVHHVALMPALPKATAGSSTQVRTAQEERDNGMIAARYRFGPRTGAGYSTVNVELAWWSAQTGQVHRGVLPTVKPFRVSRFQLSGTARIVDGGLVFRGADGDVIHFIHDDGKIETLTAPGISFDEAWHSGKRWVVAESGAGLVTLSASEDSGKTWTQRSWGFGHSAVRLESTLESLNGNPTLRVQSWLFDVAGPLKDDPPAPTLVDATGDARCEASPVGSLRHVDTTDGASPISVELTRAKGTPETLETVSRVLHDTQSGKLCTSVYLARLGDNREAYLYPEKSGAWSGWYRRPPDDPKKDRSVIEPLICK